MTARVVIRRSSDVVSVLVDGRIVVSASDDDTHPDESPLSTPRVAAVAAEDVARALGATVTVVRS